MKVSKAVANKLAAHEAKWGSAMRMKHLGVLLGAILVLEASIPAVANSTETVISYLRNFEVFLAQWTGLTQARAQHRSMCTTFTTEDKAWMLENLTGQGVKKVGAGETTNDGVWRNAA